MSPPAGLHLFDRVGETIDGFPVGKLFDGIGVGGAFGHPHDEAYHLPVEDAILLIVEHSGKDGQMFGFPADLLEEFDEIGIGVGLILFRFPGNHIDREEGIGFAVEQFLVFFDEVVDIFVVLAVADAGTDDDRIIAFEIERISCLDGMELDFVFLRTNSVGNIF